MTVFPLTPGKNCCHSSCRVPGRDITTELKANGIAATNDNNIVKEQKTHK
jgi:hypothetical protein